MDNSFVNNIVKIRLSQLGYLPDLPYHLISDNEMIDAFLHAEYEERPNEQGILEIQNVQNPSGYFIDAYPCPDPGLKPVYDDLVRGILTKLVEYRRAHATVARIIGDVNGDGLRDISDVTTLVRWLEDNSITINELNSDINLDGVVNDLDVAALQKLISTVEFSNVIPDWIYSYMLGEVVGPTSRTKDIHDCLVLLDLDNIDDIFTPQAASKCLQISRNWLRKLPGESIPLYTDVRTLSIQYFVRFRPPTIFGEPHVIKSLRLAEVDLQ